MAFGAALAADPGSYAVTGGSAAQRWATGSGAYVVTGSAAHLDSRIAAGSGAYVVTLGAFELRRTGYDWSPDQYGIGHVKLAMAEARRRAVVVRPTPRPVQSRLPALPQYVPPVPVVPPVPGLVGDTGFADRLEAAQVERTARAEALRKQQARNRTIAALLLAA